MKKSEESLFPFLEKLQSSKKLEGASPKRKVTNSVELDVEFLGRDKEMDLIHNAFENNWKARAEKKSATKQDFWMVQISGWIGQGKSRLAVESCSKYARSFCTLFLDLSRGDHIGLYDSVEQCLATSILAHFLGFQTGHLRGIIQGYEPLLSLHLEPVVAYLAEKIQQETQTTPVVNIILDEAHLLESKLDIALKALSNCFTTSDSEIVLNIVTTATAVVSVQNSVTASGVSLQPIYLFALEKDVCRTLILSKGNSKFFSLMIFFKKRTLW